MKTKLSVGAIVCRRVGGVPQIFMVKSRVQLAYREFLYGRYKYRDPQTVLNLLNDMTVSEKVLIMNRDFSRMWHHVWLSIPTASTPGTLYQFYSICKTRFERYTQDGGRRLCELIKQSRSAGDTYWSFPRGRPEGEEKDLDCARRELYEEGNIPSSAVRVVDAEPVTAVYSTPQCNYSARYHIMECTTGDIREGVSFNNPHQYREIADTRWVSLADLSHMNCMNDIRFIAARALGLYKKFRTRPTVRESVRSTIARPRLAQEDPEPDHPDL